MISTHNQRVTMKKRAIIVSILLHALLLMTVYVFQHVVFPFMRLGGLVPLLLPVASTGIALYEGRDTGGVTGLFAGILCDISFNQPAGVFTVLLTLTGLFVGALADSYILRGFVTFYISVALVLIISAFVQMFPLLISTTINVPMQALTQTAIGQTIYSLILALPIWIFVRAISKHTERTTPTRRST